MLISFQNPKVAVWNGYVISTDNLQGMFLLIDAGIKVKPS